MNRLLSTSPLVLPEPAWDVAQLFPPQGQWSEEEYLALPGNRLVELSDGFLEVLPMPTDLHQIVLILLLEALRGFVKPHKLGRVSVAGLPIRLWKGKFREPDVVFMLAKHRARCQPKFWVGADLAMEVGSDDPKSRKRDYVEKRADYARARIPEYWIVDPWEEHITVLRLRGQKYVVHGKFTPGDRATSVVLKGFEVDVAAVLAGEED